jgi:hypothetical protein
VAGAAGFPAGWVEADAGAVIAASQSVQVSFPAGLRVTHPANKAVRAANMARRLILFMVVTHVHGRRLVRCHPQSKAENPVFFCRPGGFPPADAPGAKTRLAFAH